MRIFISSVVNGFERFREAARCACDTLDLTPVMSEDFGARPYPSEQACLTEIEHSDAFILILGSKYGYEQAPGVSVTQQEFRHAVALKKSILVFIHDEPAEPLQKIFQQEVSEYHSGFCRVKFSAPEELMHHIIKNISRLSKQQNACSADEFLHRLEATSRDFQGHSRQYEATFVFAFFPQPNREVLLGKKGSHQDQIFMNLCQAGLADMRSGYHAIDAAHYTGLDAGKTSVRLYDDGLISVKASASSEASSTSFANWYVPPTRLGILSQACYALIDSNSGWCRLGLEDMEHAVIEEPPADSHGSFSSGTRREVCGHVDKLFIPLTEGAFDEWSGIVIQKLQRKFSS